MLESACACNEAESGFDALAMVQQVSEVEDIESDLVPEKPRRGIPSSPEVSEQKTGFRERLRRIIYA